MPTLSNKVKSVKGVAHFSLVAVAAALFMTPGLSAQDKDAPKSEKVGVTKADKQKGRTSKGSAGQPEDAPRRYIEPDTPPVVPAAVPDEATVAAQRAITTLNAVIKKAEDSGRDVGDLRTRAAELKAHLSSRDKTPAQISAEASAATLQAVDQLPDLPTRPAEPGRRAVDTKQRKSDPDPDRSQEADPPQSKTSQAFPFWLSVLALTVSLAALVIVPFYARAAVRKTLRSAGLI